MKTYKGVQIIKEKVEIPNLKELKDGTIKEFKPFIEVVYRFPGGYPYSSVEEVKEAIDIVHDGCVKRGIPDDIFVEEMNTGR